VEQPLGARKHRPFPFDWMPILIAAAYRCWPARWCRSSRCSAVEALIIARRARRRRRNGTTEPTWGGALLMGIAQSAAILPGISRSGSTVLAGCGGASIR
jgi:hypothetical protein